MIVQIQMIRSQMRKKYGDTNYIDFILLFLDVIVLLMIPCFACIWNSSNYFRLIYPNFILLATFLKFQQKSLNGVICLYLLPSSMVTGLLNSVLYRTQQKVLHLLLQKFNHQKR